MKTACFSLKLCSSLYYYHKIHCLGKTIYFINDTLNKHILGWCLGKNTMHVKQATQKTKVARELYQWHACPIKLGAKISDCNRTFEKRCL